MKKNTYKSRKTPEKWSKTLRVGVLILFCIIVGVVCLHIICFINSLSDVSSVNISVPDEKYTIVIDPGHGGRDGGATYEGVSEKDINLKIGLYLREEMRSIGYNVIMTREDDSELLAEGKENWTKRDDLKIRRDIIEAQGNAIAVSIHLNSFSGDGKVYGAQVFYPLKAYGNEERYEKSKALAKCVQDSIEMNIDDGRKRLPMEKDKVLLLKQTTKPIILVECGFLSNDTEREKLTEHLYQERLAKAICNGIKLWLKQEEE